MRFVCKMVSLSQASENVFSSDASASSVLVYYRCSCRPSGTSIKVLRLIQQDICYSDIGKCLITCNQIYFTFWSYDCSV